MATTPPTISPPTTSTDPQAVPQVPQNLSLNQTPPQIPGASHSATSSPQSPVFSPKTPQLPPVDPVSPQQMNERKQKLKELYGKYAQIPIDGDAFKSLYHCIPTNSNFKNDFLVVMPRIDPDQDVTYPPPPPKEPQLRESRVAKLLAEGPETITIT